MNVCITPDISPLVGKLLQKLTFFHKSDLFLMQHMMNQSDSQASWVSWITSNKPALVITRSRVLTEEVIHQLNTCKVVLLLTQKNETYSKLWMTAFDLDIFMVSDDKVFVVQ